jgi:predicted anti-sigma-YlaC factor YlaD
MSVCEEIRELMSARIDGELTAAESLRLEEHLASCEACREELAALERAWGGLDALGEISVPEGLTDRVVARVLAARRGMPPARRRVRVLYPLAAAAAVILALFVGSVLMNGGGVDRKTRQIVANIDLLQNLDVVENLDVIEQMGDSVLLLSEDATADGAGEGGS